MEKMEMRHMPMRLGNLAAHIEKVAYDLDDWFSRDRTNMLSFADKIKDLMKVVAKRQLSTED